MNIVVISNYYPPHYYTGHELACRDMTEYLIKKGHTVHVLTSEYGKNLYNTSIDEKNHTHRVLKHIDYDNPSILNNCKLEKYNYIKTKRLLKQLKPDIVYIWSLDGVSLAPVVASRDENIRIFYHISELWPKKYIVRGVRASFTRLLKSTLPFTIGGKISFNNVAVTAKWMVKILKKEYDAKHVYHIPEGVTLPPMTPKRRSHFVNFVYVGRIIHEKGLHYAINALATLVHSNEIRNFIFNIFGDGDPDYITFCKKQVIRGNLAKYITFYGRVENIEKYYAEHEVLLMPTLQPESSCTAILEAMSHQLTVITTNHYGPKEIITNEYDGFLYEPGDQAEFREKILNVYNNIKVRLRIGSNARKTIEERYEFNKLKSYEEYLLTSGIQNPDNYEVITRKN